MTVPHTLENLQVFHHLAPAAIIDLIESALGRACSNLCRPYNSYINQVYELQDANGQGLVVKFYRPGRWELAAIQDEHDFLLDLQTQEIPVVAPLRLNTGATLASYQGVPYAVFPKRGGRYPDEFSEEQWIAIGRLLGRVHLIGASRQPRARQRLLPQVITSAQVDYLAKSGLLPGDLASRYRQVATDVIRTITPMVASLEMIRIHGDCHRANIIDRPGEALMLIDFDDMVVGPPVQDLWMLLPGTLADAPVEMDLLLEGYEAFRPFARSTLRLIEPLRAMRYIHYAAWCARQVVEDGRTQVREDFGSREYWLAEIDDLAEQLERIQEGEPADHSWP